VTVATLGSYSSRRVGAENVMRISELLFHTWRFTIYSLELETDKDNWSLNCLQCLIIAVHVSFVFASQFVILNSPSINIITSALGKAS
jgi:hypothetical protein